MTSTWTAINEGLTTVACRVQVGIVEVWTARSGGGTGIVVDPSGLVLTSAHVLRSRRLRVRLASGETRSAQIVGLDRDRDLAVLATGAEALPALPLRAAPMQAGEVVLGVGHPAGLVGAVTVGVVLEAGIVSLPAPLQGREWVLCDAHLRPGHSGGPLVDAEGRVAGVCTMVLRPDLGVAVPASVAREFLNHHLARA